MRQTIELIKRNFKLYYRDKSAVSFSLLTMLIVVALMVLFLGDMNVNNLLNLLEQMGVSDPEAGRENAKVLILLWTLAGIIAMNSITVPISILGNMVQDQSRGRFKSFYTSPVSRTSIGLGYIGASVLGSVFVCLITLGIADFIAVLNGAGVFSLLAHGKIFVIILVNSFCYSSIMYFAAQWIRSENGWSGFSTIIGTLAGFLGAIYIPMEALPSGVQTFLKFTPVLHSTSVLRTVFTESILGDTFQGLPESLTAEYQKAMGITVSVGDRVLNPGFQVVILLLCGIIALTVSATVMRKRAFADR